MDAENLKCLLTHDKFVWRLWPSKTRQPGAPCYHMHPNNESWKWIYPTTPLPGINANTQGRWSENISEIQSSGKTA